MAGGTTGESRNKLSGYPLHSPSPYSLISPFLSKEEVRRLTHNLLGAAIYGADDVQKKTKEVICAVFNASVPELKEAMQSRVDMWIRIFESKGTQQHVVNVCKEIRESLTEVEIPF